MPLTTSPLPADVSPPGLKDDDFGIIVHGVQDINSLTDDEFEQIETLLYKYSLVLFPGVKLTPQGQHEMTHRFDPNAFEYGHGGKNTGRPDVKSILHPDLRNLPGTTVQLIGNGPCTNLDILQGLPTDTRLKHPSHESFHKNPLSAEERNAGQTRFYRWHIDAALYERDPPKVTTLYGLDVLKAPKQTLRYDDGTDDTLQVPLGGTSFISGKKMFDILPQDLKSLAVRAKITYAPHPYVWITPAKSNNLGLGMENDGLEVPLDKLPEWDADKVKTYPMVWKNPKTGHLHLQIHPSAIHKIIIAPLPAGKEPTADTLYPNGGEITDLAEVRELVYRIQRPAIAPQYVYTHDWNNNDLALFHNRGVLHSVTGTFQPDDKRAFWQCNLASSDSPVGPNEDDVLKYA